jgi:hypothetical protein
MTPSGTEVVGDEDKIEPDDYRGRSVHCSVVSEIRLRSAWSNTEFASHSKGNEVLSDHGERYGACFVKVQ